MSVLNDGTIYSAAHIPKVDMIYHYSPVAHTARNSIVGLCKIIPTFDGNGDFDGWDYEHGSAWNVREVAGNTRHYFGIRFYNQIDQNCMGIVSVKPNMDDGPNNTLDWIYSGNIVHISDPTLCDWDDQWATVKLIEQEPKVYQLLANNPNYPGLNQPLHVEVSVTTHETVDYADISEPFPECVWVVFIGSAPHYMIDNTGTENAGTPSSHSWQNSIVGSEIPGNPVPSALLDALSDIGGAAAASIAALNQSASDQTTAGASAATASVDLLSNVAALQSTQATLQAQQNTIIQQQALAEYQTAVDEGTFVAGSDVQTFIANPNTATTWTAMAVANTSFTNFSNTTTFGNFIGNLSF